MTKPHFKPEFRQEVAELVVDNGILWDITRWPNNPEKIKIN
jgi:hypothetical protein